MISAGFLFEALVAFVLVIAAVLAWRVDRRLSALRSGADGVAKAVAELVEATNRAQASIQSLRAASSDAGAELDAKLVEARALAESLSRSVGTHPLRSQAEPRETLHDVVRIAPAGATVEPPRAAPRPTTQTASGARARAMLETMSLPR